MDVGLAEVGVEAGLDTGRAGCVAKDRRLFVGAMDCRFAAVRGAGEAAGAMDARLAGVGASFCTASGFAKMPCIGLQAKYLLPCTDPSFFPFGSASSIPIQTPGANSVVPTKRTTPRPCAWLTLSPSTTLADAIDMSS